MRKLTDLLKEEPVALTTALQMTGNVVALVADVDAELVAGLNLAFGAWWAVLRWLVVPAAVAEDRALEAGQRGLAVGYDRAVADVNLLAEDT